MQSSQQYIDLFRQSASLIDRHSAPAMNALRAAAFDPTDIDAVYDVVQHVHQLRHDGREGQLP